MFALKLTRSFKFYIILIITRSIIVSKLTKSLHMHYMRFGERMTEEMSLQIFPENRY